MAEGNKPDAMGGATPDAGSYPHSGAVFISYSSADSATADSVVASLEGHGVGCWIAPRDVTPGSQYAEEIIAAINEAKVIVLVLSENAVASAHVGKEIERASSKRRRIIALRTDATPLTRALEYFLSESQWIDVADLGMPAALTKLTQAVRRGLTPSSWAVPKLGADADNLADRKRKSGYLTIQRMAAVAVFLVAAIVVGVVIRSWPSRQRGPQAPAVSVVSDKSIAVLPFTDMSQKHDQEYFGDGMAEEILDLLAKIPGLTVIGRTSSFQFKGKSEDLRKIGTELNAAYVLEGSVRSSGDQVRITAQLINTRTGAHEWSETYDRPIGDVLKLQDAIAAAVVRELQLTVASGYLHRSTVRDAEAYDLMLRGRHAVDRLDKEGFDEGTTLFQQALDRDPTSADAAAALAWTYDAEGEWQFLAPTAAFEPARRAAAIALELDPKSPLAHYVLGRIHVAYDWDWAAAEREYNQVEALAPGKAGALDSEALLSMALGRWDDALSRIKSALAQDPLDPASFFVLTEIQMRRGHLSEAEAAMRKGLDIRPTFALGHFLLGLVLVERGDLDAALSEMQREPTDYERQAGLAMTYYALGRRADSDVVLDQLLNEHADINAFQIAEVYAFRGQSDDAMHWLERAYAQKDAGLYFVKVELPQKTLAADPRFKAFLRKMNLPQ